MGCRNVLLVFSLLLALPLSAFARPRVLMAQTNTGQADLWASNAQHLEETDVATPWSLKRPTEQPVLVTPWGEVKKGDLLMKGERRQSKAVQASHDDGAGAAAAEAGTDLDENVAEILDARAVSVSRNWKGWELLQRYLPRRDVFRLSPQEEAEAERLWRNTLSE